VIPARRELPGRVHAHRHEGMAPPAGPAAGVRIRDLDQSSVVIVVDGGEMLGIVAGPRRVFLSLVSSSECTTSFNQPRPGIC
jgi:hypothetical protein